MPNRALFFILFILAGCASGPALNESPLGITSSQLAQYWEKPADFNTFDVKFGHEDGKCRQLTDTSDSEGSPHVIYSYLIDSKGKTYERRYLEKSSDAVVNLAYLNRVADNMMFIDGNTYIPASTNVGKTPVRVSSTLYVVELPGDCGLTR